MALTLIFVHGYSVTDLSTYGELPLRLKAEAASRGVELQIEEIFLGRYISFDDAVVLDDISRAFQTAVKEKLPDPNTRFVCITHSTGGPVVRNWWNIYYNNNPQHCPLSHLIMLAPANYGSALAQLGKSVLGRLKSWVGGVEPGQGVLNWLELGSAEAWTLNQTWIMNGENQVTDTGVFPFVITGQYIDRQLYDNLNSYTGELGSDGVVRSAAANLQGNYIQLNQLPPTKDANGNFIIGELVVDNFKEAMPTPFRIVSHKSHTGDQMGIMWSIKKEISDTANAETVNAIFECLNVQNKQQYNALITQFDAETKTVQANEKIEIRRVLLKDRVFIHDRFSMVIFRVTDTDGRPVTDFDLILTAGPDSNPNHLPEGFFADRQCNRLNKNTLTYFFNYDIMQGSPVVKDASGKVYRDALPGALMLGFQLKLRPDSGFVKYVPCEIKATQEMLQKALQPNATTMIDICVQRIVDKEVSRLVKLEGNVMPDKTHSSFKDVKPSGEIAD